MTPQKQIAVIAEADGWTYKIVEDGHLFSDPSQPQKVMRWVSSNGVIFRKPPDYLGSRDAIISVIEKQPQNIKLLVHFMLHEIISKSERYIWEAKAEELSESLIRALGKWEDGE